MTAPSIGYSSTGYSTDRYPGPLRITSEDGQRALFLEAPTTGADTAWLWIRNDDRYLALSIELTAAEWRQVAARAAAYAEALDPTSPAAIAARHIQGGRSDGTWGCACGWTQDKPHTEHVADMVAAARTQTPDQVAPAAGTGA